MLHLNTTTCFLLYKHTFYSFSISLLIYKNRAGKKKGDLLCYQSTASSLTVTLFRLQNNWEGLFVTLSGINQRAQLHNTLPFVPWRAVSTLQRWCSPRRSDTRLLGIPTSYGRVPAHNSYINLLWWLAHCCHFASFCQDSCGTSIAQSIRAMRVCHIPWTIDL